MKITMHNKGRHTVVALNLGEFRRRLNFLMKNEKVDNPQEENFFNMSFMYEAVNGMNLWNGSKGYYSATWVQELSNIHRLVFPVSDVTQYSNFFYFFNSKEQMEYTVLIENGNERTFLEFLNGFIDSVNSLIMRRLTSYIVVVKDKTDKSITDVIEIIERRQANESGDGI